MPLIDFELFQCHITGRILLSKRSYSSKKIFAKAYLSKSGSTSSIMFSTVLGDLLSSNCANKYLFFEGDISNVSNGFNFIDLSVPVLLGYLACPGLQSSIFF